MTTDMSRVTASGKVLQRVVFARCAVCYFPCKSTHQEFELNFQGQICFNTRPSTVSEMTEPILADNPERFVLFPIKYLQVWEMYKKAEASFWTG